MKMSLDEFEAKFFEPAVMQKQLELRPALTEQYRNSDPGSRWTTYFMMLGMLAAAGRVDAQEFQQFAKTYNPADPPTPERLYVVTCLMNLLK